jgi:hypothetical protein
MPSNRDSTRLRWRLGDEPELRVRPYNGDGDGQEPEEQKGRRARSDSVKNRQAQQPNGSIIDVGSRARFRRDQHSRAARMTSNTDSNPFVAEDLIEQATGVLMERFDLDAAGAVAVLRRMSQNTSAQMCVVAEQVINRRVPPEAVRGIEEVVLGAWRT